MSDSKISQLIAATLPLAGTELVPVALADGSGNRKVAVDALRPRNNFAATTNPGVNDDGVAGYSAGSRWFNSTLGLLWLCSSAATGAAVWRSLPSGMNALLSGLYSAALGFGATDRGLIGSLTLASGFFANPGDCQVRMVQLRRAYSGTTAMRLTSDGNAASASNVVVLPDNSSATVLSIVQARAADNTNYADWFSVTQVLRGAGAASVIMRNAISFQGGTSAFNYGASTPSQQSGNALARLLNDGAATTNWNLTFTADTTLGAMNTSFVDSGGSVVRVNCFQIIVEVTS
jgi:hypothetical protein